MGELQRLLKQAAAGDTSTYEPLLRLLARTVSDTCSKDACRHCAELTMDIVLEAVKYFAERDLQKQYREQRRVARYCPGVRYNPETERSQYCGSCAWCEADYRVQMQANIQGASLRRLRHLTNQWVHRP